MRNQTRRPLLLSRLCLLGLLAFCTDVALHTPAYASSPAQTGALQEEFQHAFWAMLADPSDPEKTVRYAEAAVKIGDYESAIPPLERLLMQNPQLTRVRLEVGVLYYLLNSREVARGYLLDVKQDPAADKALVERADAYLARL